MQGSHNRSGPGLMFLKGGVSLVALTAMAAALATPVCAQDATSAAKADDAKEVVVVGVRRSLKTAQQIKKDADTVVDTITATDIGAFPDKSVAEALQRVAGITVTRFAATGDTAHFSAEPSGVLVRGLQQVRSEFNGRDTFSANSSRGLSWGDVSPELMSGVDTYKNQTADLIEGGIAGSINLRTRVPFDSKGQLIAISADLSHGDLANVTTPDYSGIYSNRWDTSIGEFGVMLNYAYSRVVTDSQGIIEGRDSTFCSTAPKTNSDGTVQLAADGSIPCAASPYGTSGWAYIPNSVTYQKDQYNRIRNGIAFAGQWQNHDHTMVATFQYNDSKYHNTWQEIGVGFGFPTDQYPQPPYDPVTSQEATPLSGTSFTFGKNGLFQSGTMTSPIGWWGADNAGSAQVAANSSGGPLVTACYGWNGCNPAQKGIDVGTFTRYNNNQEYTRDASFNFKWDVNDHIKTNFDVQYVESTVSNYDIGVGTSSFANLQLDMSGKYPVATVLPGTNINYSPGGLNNPDNYRYQYVQDHYEDSSGHELATRFDVEYDFGEGWVSSLKMGVRYADRKQTVRWGNYNWANIANTWASNASYYNIDKPVYPAIYENNGLGNNFFGGENILNVKDYVFLKQSAIQNESGLAHALGAPYIGVGSWDPYCSNTGSRAGEIETVNGHCYRAAEILGVDEKTLAGYAFLKFGGPDKTIFNGITVTGNVGLRWVQTEDVTSGGTSYPVASTVTNYFAYTKPDNTIGYDQAKACAAPLSDPAQQTVSNQVIQAACVITPAVVAFDNGGQSLNTARAEHINWLPSFNIKFGLSDTWLIRFAASRAMSRPDLGYLKNYVSISGPSINVTNTSSALIYNSPTAAHTAANVTGYNFQWTASAGNPYLKPVTADQFDLSAENYFASVGSLTFDLFYKKFYNYIQYGKYTRSFTNNGVTEPVTVSGPINSDGAAIRGFELAYQRYFDFLPSPFNGLGVQANYTHVVNSGIKNTNAVINANDGQTNAAGGGNAQAATSTINPGALEGLSPDSYNVVLLYEKGSWGGRLAYNYRSTFLVTALDCCTGLPMWQKGQGQLDGSIRYKVNDHLELDLEGSNLMGSETVLEQQVFGDSALTPGAKPVLLPASWFKNDRRVQFGIRMKY